MSVRAALSERRLVPAARGTAPPRATAPLHGLVRHRLVDLLEPSDDHRIRVLRAAQGSGKTIALTHWAALSPSSTTVLAPEAADDAATLFEVAAAAVARGTTVLALDDADEFPECVRMLCRVLAHAPHVRLLLTGRTLPAVDLARGELRTSVVPGEALRFREHEVASLYRDVLDTPLVPLDTSHLTRHTAGWAAGLDLFHLSIATTSPAERHRAVAGLNGRVVFARHYLRHQALGGLSPTDQVLLRRTSPLELLTPSLCRRFLGEDVQLALGALDSCTLVSSPDAGVTRVLHPLLRAHLLTELRDELGDTVVDALLRRAAHLHAEEGETASAARALVRARSWGDLVGLVDDRGPHLWQARDLAWIHDVPDDVADAAPSLRLTRALVHLHAGRLQASLDDALAAARSDRLDGSQRAVADRVISTAGAWLNGTPPSAGPGVRTAFASPMDAMVAPPSSPGASQEADAVLGPMVARLLRGELSVAQDVAEAGASHDSLVDLVTHIVLAVVRGPDRIQLESLAHQARVEHRPWLAQAVDLIELGHAYRDGRPDPDTLMRRTLECDQLGDPWGAALASAVRAVMLLLARQPDVAAFETLCERLRWLNAPTLETWARAGLALASAASDLPDADRDAEAAVSFATACQLPAVRALAHLAGAGAGARRRTDRLVLAGAEAAAVGFDLEPWARSLDARIGVAHAHESVPVLRVRCFGEFEVAVRGVAPALDRVRPRAREVLRLLALHQGRPVHREVLLALLWPDLDTSAATHNLHVAVSTLRTCLEPGIQRGASSLVVRRGEHYQLAHPPGTECDLTAFDCAVVDARAAHSAGDLAGTRAAQERALEIYRGDVLPEDGPAEWVVDVRDRYRMRAGDVAGDLAALLLEQGEHHAAAATARRSVDLAPWRDSSWRTLELACRAAGDLAAAERARADYGRLLAGLGVGPTDGSATGG